MAAPGILGGAEMYGLPPSNAWQDNSGGASNPLWEYLQSLYQQLQSAPQIPNGGGPQQQLTNTARPDILAPMTGSTGQAQPSQQPQPRQPQAPLQLGGYDLSTIGPGLDSGGDQQLPAGSTPAQGQGGVMPPQQSDLGPKDFGLLPGIFGNLQAAGSNFTSGGNPIAGAINSIGGLLTGQRTDAVGVQRQMQMAQYQQLLRDGIPPGKALAMIQSPQILQNYYDTRSLGTVKNVAGAEGPLVTSQGQMIPMVPSGGTKELREVNAAKAEGTAQGTAAAGLANTHALFDKGIEDIDAAIKDPNLKYAVGLPGAIYTHIPGHPAQEAAARLKQLHGEASLAGLQYLQKIGRLNINEFNAGSNAISRLQEAQSEKAVIASLQDLRRVFVMARSRSGETAGVGPTPSPNAPMDLGGGWSVQQRNANL